MLKGVVLGVILAIIVAAGVGYLAIVSGAIPANADAVPGSIEQ